MMIFSLTQLKIMNEASFFCFVMVTPQQICGFEMLSTNFDEF